MHIFLSKLRIRTGRLVTEGKKSTRENGHVPGPVGKKKDLQAEDYYPKYSCKTSISVLELESLMVSRNRALNKRSTTNATPSFFFAFEEGKVYQRKKGYSQTTDEFPS